MISGGSAGVISWRLGSDLLTRGGGRSKEEVEETEGGEIVSCLLE
jgi:hypothetical protein